MFHQVISRPLKIGQTIIIPVWQFADFWLSSGKNASIDWEYKVELSYGGVMGFFERLSRLTSPSSRKDEAGYWVYAICSKCGEKLRTRINLNNDLSIEYDESGNADTYICHKIIVGSRGCFQRLELSLKFDSRRKLMERDIAGGYFIEENEYLQEET